MRIGVFICHCGINIAGKVDIAEARAAAEKLPGVAHVADLKYSCSSTGQTAIKKAIKGEKLDRILSMLKERKARFKNALREARIPGMKFRTLNDPGECATLLVVIFDDAVAASRVAKELGSKTVAESGWHVYNHMEQILAVTDEKGKPRYRKGMLPRTDDILVTMAGPAMNLILAVALVGLARVGLLVHQEPVAGVCWMFARLSLLLCFFNLIPIPPLDGSHVLRNLTNMSWETYANFARFGFIAVIVVIQIPQVRQALWFAVDGTHVGLAALFGIPLQ